MTPLRPSGEFITKILLPGKLSYKASFSIHCLLFLTLVVVLSPSRPRLYYCYLFQMSHSELQQLASLAISRRRYQIEIFKRTGVWTPLRHSAGYLIGKGFHRPKCQRTLPFETSPQPGSPHLTYSPGLLPAEEQGHRLQVSDAS